MNDDGTVSVLSFDRPKYFDPGDGKMALIDTTIMPAADRPGVVTNTAGALRVWFSPILGNGDGGVEVSIAGKAPIRFWPSFAKPADPKAGVVPVVGTADAANVVTYSDVAPGVDLVYTVETSGLA